MLFEKAYEQNGLMVYDLKFGSDGGNYASPSKTSTFAFVGSSDYEALSQLSNGKLENPDINDTGDGSQNNTNAYNQAIDYYIKDYKNPANMPFVPYLENVLMTSQMSNLSNTFTDISLKAVEGVGPQYLGGQDTQIELQIVTSDYLVVSMLNNLPTMASAMAKKYKRILPAWPIKIKSEMTDLIGVSEVLIDMLEVNTVEGFPGVYSIAMRLTSVDRTQRQREALRRLDVAPQGGNVDYNGSSNLAIKEFFSIDRALSEAELYPDLDLPTLDDMAKKG
ncbi:hypothetical protein [Paraclostridium dentum]|uniref:hypothetical protein n=1 Tax=Paraclostridium dentum TaxID=2662455 RepID=UPI003F2E439B